MSEVRQQKEAEKHSTAELILADLILYSSYMGQQNVRVFIGSIPPEIQEVLLVAAVMSATQKNTKPMSVGRMQQMNWWNYDLEIILQATHQDIEMLPYEIKSLRENSLKVIVEERRPNCCLRGQRGQCPNHKLTNTKETIEP